MLPLEKDEFITFTTMFYPEVLEPYVFYGTSKGKVLILPLYFKDTENEPYEYYVINFVKE